MMNFKTLFFTSCIAVSVFACNQKSTTETTTTEADTTKVENKGIGDVISVDVDTAINEQMAERGKAIFDKSCASCHKLTDEKLVGPGFKGVTQRRKPEWIMNMITNTTQMLQNDPDAKELLEKAKVHMPQHPLAVPDARDILEFLRKNDQ